MVTSHTTPTAATGGLDQIRRDDHRMRQAVRSALPDLSEQVQADKRWPALRRRLLAHERAGSDVRDLLARVDTTRIDRARSVAAVLHHAVGQAPEVSTRDRLALANAAALQLWREHAADPVSWVPAYLADRELADADVGHAPAGWTATRDALTGQGFTTGELVDAGLCALSDSGRVYDVFRDRMAFAIYNSNGQVLGFTARANPHSDADEAKYINTRTTDLYRKHQTLYGMDPQALAKIQDGADVVLVEGPTDHAALSAAIPQVAVLAPCGTALTDAQLSTLEMLSPRGLGCLVLAYDGDRAGTSAAERAWDLLGASKTDVRAAVLPTGADPAELVGTGRSSELVAAVTSAGPLADLVADQRLAGHDLDTVVGRARAVDHVARSVATEDLAAAAAVAARVRQRTGVDVAAVFLAAHAREHRTRTTDPDPATRAAHLATIACPNPHRTPGHPAGADTAQRARIVSPAQGIER